jgi:hypothetical protein
MTLVCLILSLFYPRVYASVEVQVPTMTKATAPTYQQLVRANQILGAVVVRHPEFRETTGVETVSWIGARIDVRHLGKDILEIRMSGRPIDRKRLQEMVDAIAEELVDFLTELNYYPSDEDIASLQDYHDKLKAQAEQAASLPAPDVESVRRQQMMQMAASTIQRLKQARKQSSPPPKVIRSSSGIDW